MLIACYLINRTRSPVIHNQTPYEMLFGKISSYESIRVSGCLYYAHNQWIKEDKFASQSRNVFFLAIRLGIRGGNYLT